MFIKKIISVTFLFAFMMLLAACSGQGDERLTRVDVQKVDKEGNYEAAKMITDKETIDLLKSSFEKVKWELRTKAEMARKEDVLATLFYTFDKNMPERLVEYRIWFNANGTLTIISDQEGYGTLHKGEAKNLKNNLLN